MVFVISGNYNVLYVNECKLESLYIFTITVIPQLKYCKNSILQKFFFCFGNDSYILNSWNYFDNSIVMNKNCYLQCVTVNKAGNPYVLDPDVSVSMTWKRLYKNQTARIPS